MASKRREHDSWAPSDYNWDDVRLCAKKQPGEGGAAAAAVNAISDDSKFSGDEGSGNGGAFGYFYHVALS